MNIYKRLLATLIIYLVAVLVYFLSKVFDINHQVSLAFIIICSHLSIIKSSLSVSLIENQNKYIASSFILLLLGDLIWYFQYFYYSSLFLSITINLLFSIAFLFGSLGVRGYLNDSDRKNVLLSYGTFTFSVFATIGILALKIEQLNTVNISQIIYIITALYFFSYLMIVFLMSRVSHWSFISGGILIFLVVGVEITFRNFTGNLISSVHFDYIYFLGLGLVAVNMIMEKELVAIPKFTIKSLQVQLKIVILIFSLLVVFFTISSSLTSPDRFISLGVISSIGLILSALFSQYVFEKVMGFNSMVGEIFVKELEGKEIDKHEQLPFMELKDAVDVTLKNKLEVIKRKRAAGVKLEQAQKIKEITTKVSHDIRSPLGALKMSMKIIDIQDSEMNSIVHASLSRINDIANELLEYNREGEQSQKSLDAIDLTSILESIIAQKKIEMQESGDVELALSLNENCRGLLVEADSVELQNIISNMINNSIESFKHKAVVINSIEVSIYLSSLSIDKSRNRNKKQQICVQVSDNGAGIPKDILKSLGAQKISHGKKTGNGVGLLFAKSSLDSWGADMSISSTPEVGTNIIMTFTII